MIMSKLANKDFWHVIETIKWSINLNVEVSRCNMKSALASLENYTKIKFEKEFRNLMSVINEETDSRVFPLGIYKPHVTHGADDSTMLDMPAHLIGLGEDAVNGYLNGGKIGFDPVESLSYIFFED